MSDLLRIEVDRIRESWEALSRVVDALSEDQLTRLGRDRWLIKDHLVHMALAEQFCLAAFSGQPLHQILGTDQDTMLRSSEDELNEISYQQHKSLPLSQVMDMRQKTHRLLLDTVAGFSEDALQKPYAPYGETTGMTMLDILRGNTYEHYDLHRVWIEEITGQVKSTELSK